MKFMGLVETYFDVFFNSHDFDRLGQILSKDLVFKGPLFSCETADTYIASLKHSPVESSSYKVIKRFEDNDQVNVIYEFRKDNIVTLMSQLFVIRDNKISEITLIFDSSPFSK